MGGGRWAVGPDSQPQPTPTWDRSASEARVRLPFESGRAQVGDEPGQDDRGQFEQGLATLKELGESGSQ